MIENSNWVKINIKKITIIIKNKGILHNKYYVNCEQFSIFIEIIQIIVQPLFYTKIHTKQTILYKDTHKTI